VANSAYDVFISYARVDGRHAADIDSILRSKGLSPFFDRRSFAPGLPWLRALEQVIGSAKSAIVLIGPHGLGNTQQYERELALIRQTGDQAFPVVPVILPGNKSDPPFDFLRLLSWIDFSHVDRVSDAPDALEQLLAAIHGREIAPEAARAAICPYRGLDAYREEDSAFFIGRGSADDPNSPIGELLRKVREHPFVMVVGRSGSGKSSLVYAGLLPALRREHDRFWNVLSLRPGPTPLHALAAAFNPRAENEGAADYQSKIIGEANKLRTGDPELLSYMIREELNRAEGKPDRLLLYIDQWEELYAQAPSSNDKARTAQHAADVNRFIDLLLAASRSAPVAVVGTVRADFYDPLIGHEEIKSLLPTRQVLLGKMNRSGLEQTIVEPAKKVRLTFDPPDLVQRILDEAGEDDGMLPLLQYALKETWKNRKGDVITADSYARSGGVREAIRVTAEQTFEALSAEDQQAARQLFLRLVTPGEGQEDTRARAAMPVEEAQRKIVERFAGPGARLLVTGQDRAARPTVEVAHEALIRTWPRLREWIDANREKLRSRAAILQAKAEWEQEGRREDLLLSAGFQLERARALLADPGDITTDDIKEFVSLSSAREEAALKQTEDAQRKRARIRNIALVVVSMLAVLAIRLYWNAEQQRIAADNLRRIAEEQTKQADDILAAATDIIAKVFPQLDADTKKRVFAVAQRGADHGDSTSIRNLGWLYEMGEGVTQNYARAREWYAMAAAKDNTSAMRNLGLLYDYGRGVTQDYTKAREWYEKAADKGNADAMSNLGALYFNGQGVAQDYAKAREWYEKGAYKDNTGAMISLGLLYENGQGVTQDYAKAREWYEKAADKGNADAMSNLGVLYVNGKGVAQDYAKAREWYEKAADKGNADAMINLGLLYENGQGVAQDYAKAREWYEKGAYKDNTGAMISLGLLYENGQGVAQDYAKAREWYGQAADKGDATAMSNLGTLYFNGQGGAQDYAKARDWYEKATDKGDARGMLNLGLLYENGQGVPQDYVKAREWYEKAADKGYAAAMPNVGLLYENGRGVTQDYTKARDWYEKGADNGDATAMSNLGTLYFNGKGVAQDYAKAREWYEKGADKGDADAMTNLGLLYENGPGVTQDYTKAREWYEKAADKGDANAMSNLGYENGQGVAQDYAKAREWYEQAAAKDDATAMTNLGVLYENGHGVAQDYAKAREWYEKAAAKDDAEAKAQLDQLAISEAAGAGRYAEALQLQEALAAKAEAGETKREGKPGEETAEALNNVAWRALFGRAFKKALTAADRAHSLLRDDLAIETNRAHALMFLGRGRESRALYLANRGKPISGQDGKLWERVISEDFAEFRKAGLTHPMMADIEKELGVAH
jgi:TPR repeat protein/energy-coupling factor transporter ATP-binding protein EcfA2